MSRAILTPLRLPPELVQWADRLLPAMTRDPRVTAVGRVTRSSVLRMALVQGLECLERQYNPKQSKGDRSR